MAQKVYYLMIALDYLTICIVCLWEKFPGNLATSILDMYKNLSFYYDMNVYWPLGTGLKPRTDCTFILQEIYNETQSDKNMINIELYPPDSEAWGSMIYLIDIVWFEFQSNSLLENHDWQLRTITGYKKFMRKSFWIKNIPLVSNQTCDSIGLCESSHI